MKKLTLSADPEVIKQAHKLAREGGTSLSSMFERFVRLLAKRGKKARPVGTLTRKASGMVALPRSKSAKKVLEDALLQKHGLKR